VSVFLAFFPSVCKCVGDFFFKLNRLILKKRPAVDGKKQNGGVSPPPYSPILAPCDLFVPTDEAGSEMGAFC
jgi:hypothetical protein